MKCAVSLVEEDSGGNQFLEIVLSKYGNKKGKMKKREVWNGMEWNINQESGVVDFGDGEDQEQYGSAHLYISLKYGYGMGHNSRNKLHEESR